MPAPLSSGYFVGFDPDAGGGFGVMFREVYRAFAGLLPPGELIRMETALPGVLGELAPPFELAEAGAALDRVGRRFPPIPFAFAGADATQPGLVRFRFTTPAPEAFDRLFADLEEEGLVFLDEGYTGDRETLFHCRTQPDHRWAPPPVWAPGELPGFVLNHLVLVTESLPGNPVCHQTRLAGR